MKKFFLCCSFFLELSIFAKATVIVWDGEGGDGLWTTAANWLGDIVPGSFDDVVLDNSILTVSYTVSLPAGNNAVAVNSLVISPANSNNITLVIPNSNTASPVFTVSGTGDALVLNKGAVLRNSSGAASGSTLVITNRFQINNGARYIHNTSRGNANIVSRLSTAAGTEEGEFEFDVPASVQTISLTGRTYGTLILSSTANGGPVTYSGNGTSALNIRGNLQIGGGVTLSIGMSANFTIHKNLSQSSSGVFNLQNSSNNNVVSVLGDIECFGTLTETGNGAPVLELSGTNGQQINITGSIQNNIAVNLNNPAGFTLVSPLVVTNKLEFVNGKIKTDAVNILTFTDEAFYTGASTASFAEGPVKKIGDDDFDFPVGAGTIYAPIGISGSGSNATDEFVAEYKRQNPQSTAGLGNTIESTINHISSSEYWEVTRNSGTSAKNIRLTVSEFSFAKNLNTLLVARFDGVQWRNEGGTNFITGASNPAYVTGVFQSNASVGSFGAFTIGTTDDLIFNPLPVKLISFNAVQTNDNRSILSWTLSEACLPGVMFELQRASESKMFETIAVVEGTENLLQYTFADNNLNEGVNYYRLKIKDENGAISYSRIVSVFSRNGDRLVGFLSPSIVAGTSILTISSNADQLIELAVFDMHGRVWRKQYEKINKGITTITLSVDGLQNGVYNISLMTNSGFRSVIRFVKQ